MTSVNKCEYYKIENGKRKKCRNNALTDQGLCKIHCNTVRDLGVPEIDPVNTQNSFGADIYREGLKETSETPTTQPAPAKVRLLLLFEVIL